MLAQVLVFGLLLAAIAGALARLALGQHAVARKRYDQASAEAVAQAALARAVARWNGGTPGTFSTVIGGKAVTVSVSGPGPAYTVQIEVPE